MMNDPIGNQFLLQPWRCLARVSAGSNKNFVSPDGAARGRQLPSRGALAWLALDGFDSSVLEDFSPAFHRGAGQSGNVTRWIGPGADFIDHAPVING